MAPGPSIAARTKVSPGPICTDGETFQPGPRSRAAAAPVPSTAIPPAPGAPEKFSGLIDRLRAPDSRHKLPSPSPRPLKPAISRRWYECRQGPEEGRAVYLLRVRGPAAPRGQSLLRAQARYALLPAPSPREGRFAPRLTSVRPAATPYWNGIKNSGSRRNTENSEWREAPFAGGRGGKERVARLRAEQRLAPGGRRPPDPEHVQSRQLRGLPDPYQVKAELA